MPLHATYQINTSDCNHTALNLCSFTLLYLHTEKQPPLKLYIAQVLHTEGGIKSLHTVTEMQDKLSRLNIAVELTR